MESPTSSEPMMTYCLGILARAGLVLASDSRTSAGVDQVAKVKKLSTLARTDERVIFIQSAGNLATTQAVEALLRQAAGSGREGRDILAARTLFDVACVVGAWQREVTDNDRKYVEPYGDVTAAFLVSGQIAGEAPKLFQVYPAGNFVEAGERSQFLQIGETKYGKPILDRGLTPHSSLEEIAKLALLSFDATLRSNLAVGQPIDLIRYRADSFTAPEPETFDEDTPYWRDLSAAYGAGLAALVDSLPPPPAA
jgi:putative proteasome-type protease